PTRTLREMHSAPPYDRGNAREILFLLLIFLIFCKKMHYKRSLLWKYLRTVKKRERCCLTLKFMQEAILYVEPPSGTGHREHSACTVGPVYLILILCGFRICKSILFL